MKQEHLENIIKEGFKQGVKDTNSPAIIEIKAIKKILGWVCVAAIPITGILISINWALVKNTIKNQINITNHENRIKVLEKEAFDLKSDIGECNTEIEKIKLNK